MEKQTITNQPEIVSLTKRRQRFEFKRKLGWTKRFNFTTKTMIYIFLITWVIMSLFPFIWGIVAPFNRYTAFADLGINPIPSSKNFTTENYDLLFNNYKINELMGTWFRNSLIFSVAGATTNTFFNFLAGYALARIHFRGKKMIIWYLIAGMTIPGQVTQIPTLIILVNFGFFDASDTMWYIGVIFTGATSASWVFMVRQFYVNQGNSAEEAGVLDGLSTFGVFSKVSLRMMIPLLALQFSMVFMASWNNFIMIQILSAGDESRLNMTAGLAKVEAILDDVTKGIGAPVAIAATNLVVMPVIFVYIISLYLQKKQVISGEK